tara:strand:+ start:1780 stop:2880 length:1101 start_codon:yes stop_codon:yes gene_type:complete
MEIPHNATARPDTGLYNGKVGVWLFLASEIMLFGAVFSAYVLLRVGAEPGNWSMGLMDKFVGAFNTLILIASSATIVMAWVKLKLKDWNGFIFYKIITVICASLFLIVKWGYEWPAKFTHYDITFKTDEKAQTVFKRALGADYKKTLKNNWHKRFDRDQKDWDNVDIKDKPLDGYIVGYWTEGESGNENYHPVKKAFNRDCWSHAVAWRHDERNEGRTAGAKRDTIQDLGIIAIDFELAHNWHEPDKHASMPPVQYAKTEGVIANDTGSSKAHHKHIRIEKSEISRLSSYEPSHSTFFATYYTLTGLHALHVFGGILVMLYHLLPVSRRVYEKDPVRFTNRIEITGLFWHFVDLVWIFLFPILYLL